MMNRKRALKKLQKNADEAKNLRDNDTIQMSTNPVNITDIPLNKETADDKAA